MAFEVARRQFYNPNKELEVGKSIEGYVVGKHNSDMYPNVDNIVLRTDKGELIVSGAGTLKYFFKNGNKLGYYYRFTRQADKVNQRKQTVSQWLIEIDRTKKVDDFEVVADTSANESSENIPF